mmetsp:Transcript_3192/g.7191  ORF Transcript_3192/g.7191 Transcript_3192/m.7191 type:complete len:428 (-) Transcript_3192:22-1305(-)
MGEAYVALDSAEGDLFESHASDFKRLSQAIEAGLRAAEPDCLTLENWVRDAAQVVRQMEMSARQSSRQVRLGLVRQLRTELDDLRRGVVQASSVANRDSLFGGGVGSVSREHRQRLLDAEDRLRAGVGQIESARRIALETDGIGQDILRDLKSQRETITRSRRGMTEVGAHLSSANQMLRRIAANAVKNRFIVRSVYAAILVSALLILYKRLVAPWLWVPESSQESGLINQAHLAGSSLPCVVPTQSVVLFGGEDLAAWDYRTTFGRLAVANCSSAGATVAGLPALAKVVSHAEAVVLWVGEVDVIAGLRPEKLAQELIQFVSDSAPPVVVISSLPKPAELSRFRELSLFDQCLRDNSNGSFEFADFWAAINVTRPADDESPANVSRSTSPHSESFFAPEGDVLSAAGYEMVSNLVRAHLGAIGVLV